MSQTQSDLIRVRDLLNGVAGRGYSVRVTEDGIYVSRYDGSDRYIVAFIDGRFELLSSGVEQIDP